MTNHYTNEENKFFIEFVPGHTDKETAAEFEKRFGRKINTGAVGNRKTLLGIRNGLIGGRFEKGQVSHNKGIVRTKWMSAESIAICEKTQFTKGHTPANTRAVGEERITKDGYIMVKKAARNETNNNFFDLKHKIVWEAAYGKIPKGHCLIFLDGDKTNCDLNNLRLVSRAELARLNQNHLLGVNGKDNSSAILISKILTAIGKKKQKEESMK